ncbi:hypothetical protein [Photobacterium profundum]|uniref:hypothetical protein n=1 Tax=Photobacterium profundum TaxID=74109 RepID=UPI0012F5242F|nr:hypothetical protein [Photobacterium profundum]
MKILKVEPNGIPQFTTNGFDWKNIDGVNKEDISLMLDLCINHDVILEEYCATEIKNPAQKIIFTNIYNKFKDFIEDKASFKDQVDSLYKDALAKYK